MIKKGKKKSEKLLEEEALKEEDMSVVAIICFTLLFVAIGICLGYLLYRLALNSSNVAIIINKFYN